MCVHIIPPDIPPLTQKVSETCHERPININRTESLFPMSYAVGHAVEGIDLTKLVLTLIEMLFGYLISMFHGHSVNVSYHCIRPDYMLHLTVIIAITTYYH